MRRKFKSAWNIIRHSLSVRGLLDVLGWKEQAVTLMIASGTAFIGWWKGIPLAFFPLFFLLGIALTLLVMIFVRVYRRIPQEDSGTTTPNQEPASTPPRSTTPAHGPEIVLDYHYEDDGTGRSSLYSISQPLVVRNISLTIPAYNVEIQAVQVGKGTVTFEDQNGSQLIQYIPPQGAVEMFAKMEEAGQLFQRRLPDFLKTSYQDSSLDELFGTKLFSLRVRLTDAGSQTYERIFDLQYTPWRNQVSIGRMTQTVAG